MVGALLHDLTVCDCERVSFPDSELEIITGDLVPRCEAGGCANAAAVSNVVWWYVKESSAPLDDVVPETPYEIFQAGVAIKRMSQLTLWVEPELPNPT